jgi:hypothetical protein
VHVLDQLLYLLPAVSVALLIVSLVSRRTRLSSMRTQQDAPTTESKARSRVVAGLTRWLAIRLTFVWLLVLVVRLGLTAV